MRGHWLHVFDDSGDHADGESYSVWVLCADCFSKKPPVTDHEDVGDAVGEICDCCDVLIDEVQS